MSSRPPRPPNAISIVTVAARAGVSIATVSRVVNGVANRASTGTTERVNRAIAELGYRPVSVGRALRQRRSRLVALLAANLANPAMVAIAASVEAALREQGLVMVLCDTHDRADIQDEYLLEMRAQLVRATILLGAVASPQLDTMLRDGEPILFVNRRSPDGADRPYIGVDNIRAGREVARHFLARGLPVQGLIHGSLQSSATAERIQAFQAELALGGRPLMADRVVTIDRLEHVQIGYRCVLDLVRDRPGPCGVFCSSDLIAYGAHRALAEASLRVPEDVVLVGFDDTPLNEWLAPWLSSVWVPYDRFGVEVADALAALWAGEPVGTRLLEHRLVERG